MPNVVNWEKAAANLDETYVLSGLLASVAFPVAHFVIHRLVLKPLGKYALGVSGPKKDDDLASKLKTLSKLEESAWKCLVYSTLSICSGYALARERFWLHTPEFWTDCEATVPCAYSPTPLMKFAYALDLAYYLYAIPYCVFFETKRKDFAATMAHHVITVLTISYSYLLGLSKPGLVTMFIHDVCDAPLEFTKITMYVNEALTMPSAIVFIIIWIAMRVVYFPAGVMRSVFFECVPGIYMLKPGDDPPSVWPHWHFLFTMLVLIWVLNLFWTYVILRIASKLVLSGEAKDDRED